MRTRDIVEIPSDPLDRDGPLGESIEELLTTIHKARARAHMADALVALAQLDVDHLAPAALRVHDAIRALGKIAEIYADQAATWRAAYDAGPFDDSEDVATDLAHLLKSYQAVDRKRVDDVSGQVRQ